MAARIIPTSIREHFTYCPNSGEITRVKDGRVCLSFSYGYKRVCYKRLYYPAHRVAWFLHYGEQPAEILDHIDQDRSNNRIDNLREVSQAVNMLNSSKTIGVYWKPRYNHWEAQINGQFIYSGKDLFEAHARRISAVNQYIAHNS